MYSLSCNTIVHVKQNISRTASTTLMCRGCVVQKRQEVQSLQLSSSNSSRSTPKQQQNSFTVAYLIESVGLSLDSALRASIYVKFDSPDSPDNVISFFESHGFSRIQICSIVKRFPNVLAYSPENTLLPKFEFFYSQGIKPDQLATIVVRNPKILARSLKNHIVPCFEYLNNFFKSNVKTGTAIRRDPVLLTLDYNVSLVPVINIMREHGVPDQNIAMLLLQNPRMFRTNVDNFRMAVNEVKSLGFDPSKTQFVVAVLATRSLTKESWLKKIEAYKKWGWSEEEVLEAFRKYPWCMTKSEDKIDAIMDYFINKLGWKSSDILRRSYLLAMSLENKIKPRVAVVQFLISRGLINENVSWNTLFHYSETLFLKKFVDRYVEKAPRLLELYKEASTISS